MSATPHPSDCDCMACLNLGADELSPEELAERRDFDELRDMDTYSERQGELIEMFRREY